MLISGSLRQPLERLSALPRPVLRRSLGEWLSGDTRNVVILVQDRKNRGISGIPITVSFLSGGKVYDAVTNGGGGVVVPIEIPADAKAVMVSARLPEGLRSREVPIESLGKDVVLFQSIMESPQPFVTVLEGTTAALGIAIGAAGFIWKIDWMKTVGESFFVVALFSKFARAR